MNELDKLVANLAPSKQAEVRFFVQQLLESLEEEIENMKEGEPVREQWRQKEDTLNEVKALIQSKKTELL